MKKPRTRLTTSVIAYLAFWLSLFILFTFSNIGIIPLGPVSLNLVTFLLVLCCAHLGFRGGFWGGVFLGCCSFFAAIVFGRVLFQYPLISVLPRILLGLVVFLLMNIAENTIKKIKLKSTKKSFVGAMTILIYFFVGSFSALANTLLVTAGVFLQQGFFGDNLFPFDEWVLLVWINAVLEFFAIGLITAMSSLFLFWLAQKRNVWFTHKNKW